MDDFLALVGVQAMRYAIRSGIALTSTYALTQCSQLLKSVEDEKTLSELKALRKLLDNKIKVISPAIDLIEFKSGRGNIFLESAAPLARSLQQEIVSLGHQIEAIVAREEESEQTIRKSRVTRKRSNEAATTIISNIKSLLDRIDREIPLLQLAITASGESLSTSLPKGISPSRLLQASTFLIVGDTQFAQDPTRPVQIGPAFTLSLYMLFLGHASSQQTAGSTQQNQDDVDENVFADRSRGQKGVYGLGATDRKPLWQEVLHKARVRLCRTRRAFLEEFEHTYETKRSGIDEEEIIPPLDYSDDGNNYAYHLEIIEDLDDGRVHDEDKEHLPYDGIVSAGIRESVPIHQISKIFYTDTGRILNIGNIEEGENNPVLLLKRDIGATPVDQITASVVQPLDEGGYDEIFGAEQEELKRQLGGEPSLEDEKGDDFTQTVPPGLRFPSHLDPEWIALEVFEEDDEMVESDGRSDILGDEDEAGDTPSKRGHTRNRSSLDSRLVDQIRNLSLRRSPTPASPSLQTPNQPQLRDREEADVLSARDFVARSPFGAITTSLSLMEMLIRLASLQEFQQASHLSIPDHILSFFLEETSTTGLVGETQWRARSEAKRRMGFDPYTDTPTKR